MNVLISGADRGIGFALCQKFLDNGHTVFAGRYLKDWPQLDELKEKYIDKLYLSDLDVSDKETIIKTREFIETITDRLDLLISNAGISGNSDSDEDMIRTFEVNTLGLRFLSDEFVPLLSKGKKRICVISSEAGCISLAHRNDSFAYCMSKTALNMETKIMFNRLRPEGFTFRLYHPGWVKTYMDGGVKSEEGNFEAEDTAKMAYEQFTKDMKNEDLLVMRDIKNEYWPF